MLKATRRSHRPYFTDEEAEVLEHLGDARPWAGLRARQGSGGSPAGVLHGDTAAAPVCVCNVVRKEEAEE